MPEPGGKDRILFIGHLLRYPSDVDKNVLWYKKYTEDNRGKQKMTTCFVIFGVLSFIAIADDWGLWLYLDRLYNRK